MKLIIFFAIIFLNLSKIETKRFYIRGKLTKTNYTKVKQGDEGCVYLDTNDYGNNGEITIKVTTYNSFFMEEIMYYGGTNDLQTNHIGLNISKNYDDYSHSSTSFFYDLRIFYLYYTYYFYIPVSPSQRYLYVSIPSMFRLQN
jgi:hypothetical protein